jgi:hypothetical protein
MPSGRGDEGASIVRYGKGIPDIHFADSGMTPRGRGSEIKPAGGKFEMAYFSDR